ncbi:ABC-type glycerol-3-phosphate transport system permease component [Crossiella equi]|uniref:ABC-type glycerol-3-phosphate transport system permease component n=1 Tax=Crossiella equi TaxID=130796 RepID=A0ABS5AT57_9PSEU|nr:carbohydrate ABC transporter permease [Crossiella equi]MBP2479631.1 ABC-type glycerol-3-phosphate transport system permease component [Crossiella equi]
MRSTPNRVGGAFAGLWLLVVLLPLYYVLAASLRGRADYLSGHPLAPPVNPTLANYLTVLDGGFGRYLLNNAVVTAATVLIVLLLAVPAAYAATRSTSPWVRRGFSLLLAGLAIPAQATIIPVYLLITRLHLYDSLTGVILPTAAFALPVATLVLTTSLRDVPRELYEAQAIDGAGPLRTLFDLVLPLARPAIVTVAVYTALSAWNGFLFPLVLTQSAENRVLTLGLWNFQGQFGVNVPGLLAAVTLSVLPIFVVYLIGRRFLLAGLTAGFGR